MTTTVLTPRPVVIDRMMATINGMHDANQARFGYLDPKRADGVINIFSDIFKAGGAKSPVEWMNEKMQKSVSVATGLTYYDLRAPAMNLFPTVTPLRNSIPRDHRTNPGDALRYKAVLATIGSGYPYMGWVPEGQRAASMSYLTEQVMVPYVTLGEEDSLTEEARFAAQGFEDEDALVQLRLLLKMFVKEEAGILGGNATLQLGTPGSVTLSTAGTTATLVTGTYSIKVVALTQEGYQNASLSGGVGTVLQITGNDQRQYTLNGGSSNISANSTYAVTAGQALSASVPVVNGAVAYAWYGGTTVGSETLQAITNINSISFTAPMTTTGQAASAVTQDSSTNLNVAFDGLLTIGFKNGALATPNAYVKAFATGTAGLGTGMTATGAGGIAEINTMFVTMWNKYNISPTVMYVNAQELNNLTLKMLTNSSGPLLRYNVGPDDAGMPEYKLTAAGVVAFYFNPYTPDGGIRIPVKIHPNLAPGTILAWAEVLPPWYVSNAVPTVAQMQTRQDYYAELWPRTTRAQYYGIYCQEALAVFAPFGMGILTNIANQ